MHPSSLILLMYRISACLLFLPSLLHSGYGAQILIPGSLMAGHGHTTLLSALSAELTSRGHNVTILVPTDEELNVRLKFQNAQATEIVEYSTVPCEESDSRLQDSQAGNNPNPSIAKTWNLLNKMAETQVSYCGQLLRNASVMHKLKNRNFDLIIEDMANGCDVLLPEVLKVPFIALTSNEMPYMNYNLFGFPLVPSYISAVLEGGSDRHLSFGVRFQNIFVRMIGLRLADFSSSFTPLRQEFNISPEKSMQELVRKAQFWLSQDDHLLEGPHPIMPNYRPIGGVAAARPRKLPSEFQEFADGSGDTGFVVFSTGSIVARVFHSDLVESVALVLRKLPHRVVWKHDGPKPKNLGSNTKIAPWLPQTALLAHPNARLFIGHGGLNGIYEALYHGVPMVLMPQMMMDQKLNALKVERYGYGVHLDKANFSAEIFESKIYQVLNDSRYTERVRRCSDILQDDDPMDRAVYWVEHILKFGGSHLRPGVLDLNFMQYYMIDVLAVLLGFLVVFILIFYMIVSSCISLICHGGSHKVKTVKAD